MIRYIYENGRRDLNSTTNHGLTSTLSKKRVKRSKKKHSPKAKSGHITPIEAPQSVQHTKSNSVMPSIVKPRKAGETHAVTTNIEVIHSPKIMFTPGASRTQLKNARPVNGFESVREDIVKTYGYTSQAVALTNALASIQNLKTHRP